MVRVLFHSLAPSYALALTHTHMHTRTRSLSLSLFHWMGETLFGGESGRSPADLTLLSAAAYVFLVFLVAELKHRGG